VNFAISQVNPLITVVTVGKSHAIASHQQLLQHKAKKNLAFYFPIPTFFE